MTPEKIAEVIELHRQWLCNSRTGRFANLRDADLSDADLSDADLYNANLLNANLWNANLRNANLQNAVLRGVDLSSSDLRDADLRNANLCNANLCNADLRDANLYNANLHNSVLRGVKLSDITTMPGGELWCVYLSKVLPALLTAGGRTISEVLASGCWTCHSWDNCPMHAALGIRSESESPPLLRPRIEEFIRYFDAGLIPEPTTR